jgi:hypothetical protein
MWTAYDFDRRMWIELAAAFSLDLTAMFIRMRLWRHVARKAGAAAGVGD